MDAAGNPETHKVTITVDDDGKFTYENPIILADQGDTVVWECTNKCPFAVHIGWHTPVKGRYRSVDGNEISVTIPKDTRHGYYGYYSYVVAVYKDGKIWTDDPPFIVKPG